MKKTTRFVKRESLLIFIVLLALTLRLIFLSPWLEDWDSIQFAMALKHFSMLEQTPHPPGYPVYIFLAKLLNILICNNPAKSLTLLSAFLGTAIAVPFYLLAKELANKKIAIFVTFLLLLTPIEWNLSEVALSNIPGEFFAVTAAYLLYKGIKADKYLFWGSFISGLALGVRFAEFTTVGSLLLFVLILRKSGKLWLKAAFYALLGVAFWLIPLLTVTGLKNFFDLYQNQIAYILSHDSISNYPSWSERLKQIWKLFLVGFGPFFLSLIFTLHFTRIKKDLFGWIWLLSYSLPLVIVYNLEVTRHLLPLLCPILLLCVSALNAIKPTKIVLAFGIIILILTGKQSLEQVIKLKQLTPPIIAPVIFVSNNFDPRETILITSFTYRHFQYYAPEYENHWGVENSPKEIKSKYIITDHISINQNLPILSNYRLIEKKEFTSPDAIFPRVPKTNLYVFQKT